MQLLWHRALQTVPPHCSPFNDSSHHIHLPWAKVHECCKGTEGLERIKEPSYTPQQVSHSFHSTLVKQQEQLLAYLCQGNNPYKSSYTIPIISMRCWKWFPGTAHSPPSPSAKQEAHVESVPWPLLRCQVGGQPTKDTCTGKRGAESRVLVIPLTPQACTVYTTRKSSLQ